MKKSLVVFACAIGMVSASTMAQDVYYVDDGNLPWNDALIPAAMTLNFGGGWIDENYATVNIGALLSGSTSFIYLEGSDNSPGALAAFLGANSAALEAWVSGGGKLYMNAAPNSGGNINFGFGGVTLNYPDFGSTISAVDPGHPIFNGPFGPTGTVFTGNSAAHATVSGAIGSSVMDNEFGSSVLAEFGWGSGHVMVGGMTSPQFQSPNGDILRANIIAHASTIPVPGALALLGIGGLVARRRRRR